MDVGYTRTVANSKTYRPSNKRRPGRYRFVAPENLQDIADSKLPRIITSQIFFKRAALLQQVDEFGVHSTAGMMRGNRRFYDPSKRKSTNSMTNPYANSNGTPKKGREDEFFNWARKNRQKKLNKLSPKERSKKRIAENALAKRMNS